MEFFKNPKNLLNRRCAELTYPESMAWELIAEYVNGYPSQCFNLSLSQAGKILCMKRELVCRVLKSLCEKQWVKKTDKGYDLIVGKIDQGVNSQLTVEYKKKNRNYIQKNDVLDEKYHNGVNSQLTGVNSQLTGVNSQLTGVNSQLTKINSQLTPPFLNVEQRDINTKSSSSSSSFFSENSEMMILDDDDDDDILNLGQNQELNTSVETVSESQQQTAEFKKKIVETVRESLRIQDKEKGVKNWKRYEETAIRKAARDPDSYAEHLCVVETSKKIKISKSSLSGKDSKMNPESLEQMQKEISALPDAEQKRLKDSAAAEVGKSFGNLKNQPTQAMIDQWVLITAHRMMREAHA